MPCVLKSVYDYKDTKIEIGILFYRLAVLERKYSVEMGVGAD